MGIVEKQTGQLKYGLEKTISEVAGHGRRPAEMRAEMPTLQANVLETQGLKKGFKIMEKVVLQMQKNALEMAQNIPTCEQVKKEMDMLFAKAQLDMTRDLHSNENLGRDQNLKIWETLPQAQEAKFESKLYMIEKQAVAREDVFRRELLKYLSLFGKKMRI